MSDDFEFDGAGPALYEVTGDRPHDAADAVLDDSVAPPPGGPPPYLSPSSASTFRSCQRRWEFRYIEKLPDPAGEAALAGTFAHRVLELLLQRPAAERTVPIAREIAGTVWPEVADDPDYLALELDAEAQRRFRWLAWTAIEGLWAIEKPDEIDVVATEQPIDTMLGEVPFRGIVDRLEREHGLVVSDYKSGRAPTSRFRSGRLEQVLLYAAAIHADTGEQPTSARLLYLGQETIGIEVTAARLDGAIGALEDTWNTMELVVGAGVYEPSPGPLCGWCPYADRCPEGLAELESRRVSGRIRASAPSLRFLETASA